MKMGSKVKLLKRKQQPGGEPVEPGTVGTVKNVFSGNWIYVDFGETQVACQKTDVERL